MFSRQYLLSFVGLSVILSVNADVTDGAGGADSADDQNVAVYIRPRYHVDILKLNTDNSLEHLCNGAILHSHYVITAAHCVHEFQVYQLHVRSGSDVAPPTNLPHHEQRLFHRVVKIMSPADYIHLPCRAHQHDIAILKVNRAFDLAYDNLFKQVYLPELGNDYEGYTTSVSGYHDNKLETFDAKVISNVECARNATSIITKGNLCAVVADDLHDMSSTPMVFENTLVGFMNANSKCSDIASDGSDFKCVEQVATLKTFTRITVYLEFIIKVLNNVPAADIVYRS